MRVGETNKIAKCSTLEMGSNLEMQEKATKEGGSRRGEE